jgi:hypothetical protein
MMKRALAIVAGTVLLGGGLARAEVSGLQDSFMNPPPEETVYATEHHMAYSMRSSVIYWFGGATVTDEQDLKAAERQKWWGDDIPVLPASVLPDR